VDHPVAMALYKAILHVLCLYKILFMQCSHTHLTQAPHSLDNYWLF